MGQADSAMVHYGRALAIDSDHIEARCNLGWVLLQAGRADEARPHFDAALNRNGNSLQALAGLAWALATHPDASVRDVPRARELAMQVLERAAPGATVGEVAGDLLEATARSARP